MPTILRVGGYRFHFHSREHGPPHVHVASADGSAAVWLAPVVVYRSRDYTRRQLEEIERLVNRHRNEFLRRWHAHFDQ